MAQVKRAGEPLAVQKTEGHGHKHDRSERDTDQVLPDCASRSAGEAGFPLLLRAIADDCADEQQCRFAIEHIKPAQCGEPRAQGKPSRALIFDCAFNPCEHHGEMDIGVQEQNLPAGGAREHSCAQRIEDAGDDALFFGKPELP